MYGTSPLRESSGAGCAVCRLVHGSVGCMVVCMLLLVPVWSWLHLPRAKCQAGARWHWRAIVIMTSGAESSVMRISRSDHCMYAHILLYDRVSFRWVEAVDLWWVYVYQTITSRVRIVVFVCGVQMPRSHTKTPRRTSLHCFHTKTMRWDEENAGRPVLLEASCSLVFRRFLSASHSCHSHRCRFVGTRAAGVH